MTSIPSAPFLELGSFLQYLEHSGHLRRVTKPVDKDWELACIARWALESTSENEAYAILFEHVLNYSIPVAVNLYPSPDVYASALGIQSSDDLLEYWAKSLQRFCKPALVDSAPVQEVVHAGTHANLLSLPAPVWTPGRDSGPYLSAASVITKDPETGIQNMGIYRMQIHDSTHAGLSFGSHSQHGAIHLRKYAKLQKPMPVAAVLGAPPAVTFASAAKTAYGVDELEIAGALVGSSLEVVRGKTVDLLVPARAECVIEGLIWPESDRMEGPFGEVLGYMSGAQPAPTVNVTAITHRTSPVHHGFVQQLPPSDGHLVMEFGFLGPLWFYLTRKLGLKGVRNLAIARGSAGLSILIVQIERSLSADSWHIGRAMAKFNLGQKFIYLVDDDVDIRDQDTLNWALSTRVDPDRDIEFIHDFPTYQYDPSTLARAAKDSRELGSPPFPSSLAIVNATVRCRAPEISLPSPSFMFKALKDWSATGLPPLTARRRLEVLLKTHSESKAAFNTMVEPPDNQ